MRTTNTNRPELAARRPGRTNIEAAAWLFMRISGAVLIILVFTHLYANLIAGDGIKAVSFGFVAGKWASPIWQLWDLLILWLAMIHGANGVRTIINDYTDRPAARLWLKATLAVATTVIVVLGTLVIFTFDPCPANAPAHLLPSFCTAS